MRAFDDLMASMQHLSARMDVLQAQQAQMGAMRRQSRRLHELLRCAPTSQALAEDLVRALGSRAGARSYLDDMRAECDAIFDALAGEIGLQRPNPEGHHD